MRNNYLWITLLGEGRKVLGTQRLNGAWHNNKFWTMDEAVFFIREDAYEVVASDDGWAIRCLTQHIKPGSGDIVILRWTNNAVVESHI